MLFKQQEAIIVHYPLWPSFLWRSLSLAPRRPSSLHFLCSTVSCIHLGRVPMVLICCSAEMSAFYLLPCSLLFSHLPGNWKECWMPECEITPNSSVRPNKQNMHHFSSGFCWSPLMSLKLSPVSLSEKGWITLNCITHLGGFSKRQKWVICFRRNEQMWAIWCYFLAGMINSLGKKCTEAAVRTAFLCRIKVRKPEKVPESWISRRKSARNGWETICCGRKFTYTIVISGSKQIMLIVKYCMKGNQTNAMVL